VSAEMRGPGRLRRVVRLRFACRGRGLRHPHPLCAVASLGGCGWTPQLAFRLGCPPRPASRLGLAAEVRLAGWVARRDAVSPGVIAAVGFAARGCPPQSTYRLGVARRSRPPGVGYSPRFSLGCGVLAAVPGAIAAVGRPAWVARHGWRCSVGWPPPVGLGAWVARRACLTGIGCPLPPRSRVGCSWCRVAVSVARSAWVTGRRSLAAAGRSGVGCLQRSADRHRLVAAPGRSGVGCPQRLADRHGLVAAVGSPDVDGRRGRSSWVRCPQRSPVNCSPQWAFQRGLLAEVGSPG
jgi:hypothetical protein